MADARRSELAAIHCARRDLGLDEAAYRALLRRVAKVDSAAHLDGRGRRAVLGELGRLGWTKPAARSAKRTRLPSEPHHKKIRALWLELHQAKAVKDPSEPSLDRWILRMCGLSSLRFVDAELGQRLIEMLKKWLERSTQSVVKPEPQPRREGDEP